MDDAPPTTPTFEIDDGDEVDEVDVDQDRPWIDDGRAAFAARSMFQAS